MWEGNAAVNAYFLSTLHHTTLSLSLQTLFCTDHRGTIIINKLLILERTISPVASEMLLHVLNLIAGTESLFLRHQET